MVKRRTGATKLGCLLYLLVVAGLLYFGIPAGETHFRYLEYKDAMKQELRFRSNLSSGKIKAHLRLVADSLGLPPEAGDVTVKRDGNRVTVEAEYDEPIRILWYKKVVHYTPRAADTY